MLLVLEVPYANVDKMTDNYIEKSAMFTITGERITLAIKLPTGGHLRASFPPNTKVGDTINVPTDFNLVIFPNNLSEEQIRSLSDVERLGGKIITTYSTSLHFIAG
jgi:hypothetical protein